MVCKIFDKKTGSGIRINEKLVEELHKPGLKKFRSRKVYVRFKYNIWAAHLAKVISLPSNNKSVKNLLGDLDFLHLKN